jgi:hypothetical protein
VLAAGLEARTGKDQAQFTGRLPGNCRSTMINWKRAPGTYTLPTQLRGALNPESTPFAFAPAGLPSVRAICHVTPAA